MSEQEGGPADRLSRISTMWTQLARAHEGGDSADVWTVLIGRYHGAVHRYLLGAVRDPHVADELFQEFALKFLRGDYRRADPERGRFRDFVKTSLFRLVARHRQHQRRDQGVPIGEEGAPEPAAPIGPLSEDDAAFLRSWRAELLARAWDGLQAREASGGPPFYAVLRLRADAPEVSSAEMAEKLGARLGKAVNAAWVRQSLHRAREVFSDLVLDEVSRSLGQATPEDIEAELIDLGLLEHCRSALERRKT